MNSSQSSPNWYSILLFGIIFVQFRSPLYRTYAQSCGPKVSPRLLREIPCDMSVSSFCTQPGSAYPWSAVRRYIFDNQGFMKRMYGEHRQSQIIHEEINRMNDIYDTPEHTAIFRMAKSEISSDTVGSARNAIESNTSSGPTIDGRGDDLEVVWMTTNQTSNVQQTNVTTVEMANNSNISNIISDSPDNDLDENVRTSESNDDSHYSSTLKEGIIAVSSSAPSYYSSEMESREAETANPVTTESETAASVSENNTSDTNNKETEKPSKGYNACPITQEVVAPYWANNTRGETLALLNVYPFEQYIHWEKCAFEGEQMLCREGCRCEQQYRLHRLLAFDPKNECRGIFADWFRFPGCCVCICYDNHERINNRKARL